MNQRVGLGDRTTRTLVAALLLSIALFGLWGIVDAVLEGGGSVDVLRVLRGAFSALAVAAVVALLSWRARRRHERLLDRARSHLDGLMRSSPDAIVTTDPAGRLTYLSETACALLGRSESDLIGRPASDVYARGRAEVLDLLKVLADGGEVRNRAVDLARPDGTLVPVRLSVSLLSDRAGRRVGTVAIARPRSGESDGSKEVEGLAAIQELCASVSHEVRNPLAGIRGAVQVLRGQEDRSPVECAVMGEILEQIHRLEDMVRDFTAFARPPTVRPRPENVANLVTRCVEIMRGSPSMAGVETSIEIDAGLMALMDDEALGRAITIVLENAAHAVAGHGEIHVDAVAEDLSVAIRIRDTGPGVPAEQREDVFRPFYTRKHRGTGLGLAIARRVLVSHGGSLALESPAEGGARFVMRLPAVPAGRRRAVEPTA